MRVLICGGRDFTGWKQFRNRLEEIAYERFPRSPEDELGNFLYEVVIIHGGAKGADSLADRWAVWNLCPVEAFPADWEGYGRPAGVIRNQRMLDEGRPDLVIAFPGGRGTADMVWRARKASIKVIEV